MPPPIDPRDRELARRLLTYSVRAQKGHMVYIHCVGDDTIPGPPPPLRGRVVSIEPNPSNGGAWLECAMSAGAQATVDIFDARGRRCCRLFSGRLGPGTHRFHWDGRAGDGRPAPAGTYLAVVTAAGREHARKLTVVR